MKGSFEIGDNIKTTEENKINALRLNKKIEDMTGLKPFEKEIVFYLLSKNIKYTYQITPDVISDLNNINQIGIGSIKKFLIRLKGFVIYDVVEELFTYEEWEVLGVSESWKCLTEHIHEYENIYVEDVFNQSKLIKFKQFCLDNEITQIRDITGDVLDSFKEYGGVGSKKFKEVLKILERYIVFDKDTLANDVFLDKKIVLNKKALSKFGAFTLRDLKSIFGKSKITYGIEDLKLEDLQYKTMRTLGPNINYLELEYLINLIDESKSLEELFKEDESFMNLEDILERRYVKKQTLKEIGSEYDLSKERVRQLEQIGLDKINFYIEKSNLIQYLRILYPNRAISESVIIAQIGKENKYVLEILRSSSINGISYVKDFNKYILMDSEEYLLWKNNLNEMLPDKFKWEELKNTVEEYLMKIGIVDESEEVILTLLEGIGYQKYGPILKRGHLTIHELVEYVFINDIKGEFLLNEETFKELRKHAFDKYSVNVDSNIKSFEGRIRSVKELLLVDKRTYRHINNISYPEALHEIIKETLLKFRNDKAFINTTEIFSMLKDIVLQYGVNNKYYLYSLIKHHFSDICTVGEGNTLNIYFGDDVEHTKREDDLLNYLRNKKGPICKKEVVDALHWESYKLEDILCKSKQIIPWDNHTFIKVDEFEDREALDVIIKQMCHKIITNGYETAYVLLNEALSDDKTRDVLEKNKIDAPFKIAALIKKANDEIKGHKNFLHHRDSEIYNIDMVIEHKFKDDLDKDDLLNFLIGLGYSPISSKNKYLQLKNNK